jgi:hypothetical protein
VIYSYNTETGEYSMSMPFETETGEGRTTVAPPEIPEGKAAVFNTESQNWTLVDDYRFTHKKVDSELNIYDIENLGGIEEGFYLVTAEMAENIELTPYKYKIQNGNVIEKTNDEIAAARQEIFEQEFFLTSLGYIRRKVSMSTGETKDFLSDLLPAISMGIQMGQTVPILVYNTPDFTQEVTPEYIISLQEAKNATAAFIQECALQLSTDFVNGTPLAL